MSRQPIAYSPFDPAVIADPYPYYRALRDQAPCYLCEPHGIYVLSRYQDVRAALADTVRFSSTQGVGYERRPVPMMIAYDPPEHTRLRRIVAGRFTPRVLASWEPRIAQIASALLDPLIGAGPVDFVELLCAPLPVQVIAEMMDIPIERRADFKHWSDNTVQALGGAVDLTPEQRLKVETTIGEFAMYFAGVIAERRPRAADAEDLISLLIRPSEDGEALSDMEIISFCVLLLVAGNETTTNLIGNSAYHLLQDPEQWNKLVADPSLDRSLIEESLRYDAPIQGFFRNTTQPVEIAGVTIPSDSNVMILNGSANRDESKYPNADRYLIDRNPVDHLAFGFGPHTCLGAHLARLEVRVLLRHVLAKVRGMRLEAEPVPTQNPLLRGMAQLKVSIC
jgi:cytochrome P450